MLNSIVRLAAAAALGLAPAFAAVVCTLSAVPLQVNSEGLAEPVGDVVIQCSGAAPGAVLTGAFSISLDKRVANVIDPAQGLTGGVALMQELAPGFSTPLPVVVRLVANTVIFENLNTNFDSQGTITLIIGGLHAEADGTAHAALQFSGNQPLLFITPVVTVAQAARGLFATALPAPVCCAGPAVPGDLLFSAMLASGASAAAVRLTEGHPAAFQPFEPSFVPVRPTRIRVLLKGLPPGSRVLAPDAIAGTNAIQPTSSGKFGTGPVEGMHSTSAGHSLLLSRVQAAEPDGSLGFPVWGAGPSAVPLSIIGEIPVEGDTASAVYQVVDADPGVVEGAEIPLWIFTPPDRSNVEFVVRSSVTLAPVSGAAGPLAGAPIPRYRDEPPPNDCELRGDCSAPYWPRLKAAPVRETTHTSPADGPIQTSFIRVENVGGGFLEWTVAARHRSGSGWLVLNGENGEDFANYIYGVDPRGLPVGAYDGDLVFRQVNSPAGVNVEVVIPIHLDVTEAPPPPPPLPLITSVQTVPFGFAGPFAPGALALLRGENFSAETLVTLADTPARIVEAGPRELLVELPAVASPSWLRLAASNGASQSAPFVIEVYPVAPGVVSILNSDGSANHAGSPAAAGSLLTLLVTGIRLAEAPLWVNIHDEWRPAVGQASGAPGLDEVRVEVPAGLPAMQTALRVCAKPPGGEGVCSHPHDIWLGAAPQ